MLRSPDNPNSNLRSHAADGNPSEATRGDPKGCLHLWYRGRILPGRRRHETGDAQYARRHSWTSPRRPPAARSWANSCSRRSKWRRCRIMTSGPPHAELRHLRQTVAKIAADHGLAILAAGTHPTADWDRAQQSEGERYDAVMDDLQMIGQRNMLCGLHVHVELPDPDERVDVMTRMLPYLPLFVALSTSSPFWQFAPDRAQGLSARGLRRAAAHRRAGVVPQHGGFRSLCRSAGEGRRDRRMRAMSGGRSGRR